MNPRRIESAADVAAIEARPYADFMAHRSVGAALAAAAARHPDRPALRFIEDGRGRCEGAGLDAPPVHAPRAARCRRLQGPGR